MPYSSKFLQWYLSLNMYIFAGKKKRKKPQEMNYSPLWPRSVVLLVEEDRCRLSRLKGTLFMNFTRFSRVYVSISYSAPLQMHRALTFIAEETSVRDRRSSIDRSKTSCETFFLRPYKGKRERQVRLGIYFATLDINFPRYYKFSCFSGY